MKTLLIVFLLAASTLTAAPRTPKSPAEIYARASLSLVRVQYAAEEDKRYNCTGFVVDAARGWVLTAAHCINPEGDTLVDGVSAAVVRKNEQFAVLSITPMSKPPLDLRKKAPTLGEPVTAIGYGFNVATVLASVLAGSDNGDIAIGVGLIPGMSGGPILDANGEVLGINQRNLFANGGVLGIGCGADEIRAFLEAKK